MGLIPAGSANMLIPASPTPLMKLKKGKWKRRLSIRVLGCRVRWGFGAKRLFRHSLRFAFPTPTSPRKRPRASAQGLSTTLYWLPGSGPLDSSGPREPRRGRRPHLPGLPTQGGQRALLRQDRAPGRVAWAPGASLNLTSQSVFRGGDSRPWGKRVVEVLKKCLHEVGGVERVFLRGRLSICTPSLHSPNPTNRGLCGHRLGKRS